MEFPARKSHLRRRMNTRWVRWAFWRSVFGILPIEKEWSFPMASVPAMQLADMVLDDRVQFESLPLDPEHHPEILRRAERWDKRFQSPATGRSMLFRRQVAVLRNCAVLGHVGAVVNADGAMISAHEGEVPNWNQARPKRLASRMFQHGLVTWLEGAQHYYHFHASLLPLLGYLEREHRPDKPLTVLVPAAGPRFQKEVCAAIESAYRGVRFEGLECDERAEIANYLWLHHASDNAEWMSVAAEAAAKLAAQVRRHYLHDRPSGGRLVFFSRGEAKLRRISNEAELEAIAVAHGFQRFEAHADNHEEQVRLFGEADVVVAAHGAGLTNLLYARPGTTVLEMFPQDFVKSTYLWLSLRLGMNYRALLGDVGDYRQAFRVPGETFTAALQDALEARDIAAAPWTAVNPRQTASGSRLAS